MVSLRAVEVVTGVIEGFVGSLQTLIVPINKGGGFDPMTIELGDKQIILSCFVYLGLIPELGFRSR